MPSEKALRFRLKSIGRGQFRTAPIRGSERARFGMPIAPRRTSQIVGSEYKIPAGGTKPGRRTVKTSLDEAAISAAAAGPASSTSHVVDPISTVAGTPEPSST